MTWVIHDRRDGASSAAERRGFHGWFAITVLGIAAALGAEAPAGAVCVGDCAADGRVSIADVQACVNLANDLGGAACANADQDRDGTVEANEVDGCILSFLDSTNCPMVATPAATFTAPPSTNTAAPTNTQPPPNTATQVPTATRTLTATPTLTPMPPTPTRTATLGVGCGNNTVEAGEQCDGTDDGICPDGAGCFPAGNADECECAPASCAAIDANTGGTATSGTFMVTSVGAPQNGVKYCGGTSSVNAFGTCQSDTDCGGQLGQCVPIPWLGVATFAPFPITSVITTFTAGAPDAKCVHQATVPCTGMTDPCPGTPKLGAGNPCCATAGFKVDTFFISALGFCSRVDQTACGGGVVDTSVPMLGDYDLVKTADTTTPAGPNCTYNGTETHPACAGVEDKLGRIVTTVGDGEFDPAGGQTQLTIPQRSVTWIENSAPPCSPTDMFDGNDIQITAFNLQLGTTTATSTAAFEDSPNDNDNVDFCGFGPQVFNGIAQGKPDLPTQGALTAAVGTALSGGGPTYDLMFSSLAPVTSPVLVAPQAMCTRPAAGCPE